MNRHVPLGIRSGVVAGLILCFAVAATAQTVPTFTKDVAPILFANCATCHRPGEIAPMSLLSYQDARPWSKAIQDKVSRREMPPWSADPRFGHFRNDRSLSQEQIDTIVAWVDGGSPRGNDADLPPLPTFATGWKQGTPDHIIEMPVEFELPAEGEIPMLTFYQPVPFKEDVFAQALEMRPSNPAVVHHANVVMERVSLPAGASIVNGRAFTAEGKELTVDEVRGADVSCSMPIRAS